MTGLPKSPEKRHPLEQEVIDELVSAVFKMNEISRVATIKKLEKDGLDVPENIPDKYEMPSPDAPYLSYALLDGMMKTSNNPDYNNDYVGTSLAQRTLRRLRQDMDDFFDSIAEYNKNPEKYSGRPSFPGYVRKGSASTAMFSNDGVTLYEVADKKTGNVNHYELSIPKAPCRLFLGKHRPKGRICELKIVPYHNTFVIHITTDDGITAPSPSQDARRIAAIDLGVDNFAAIVNNCGLPCLLFKGGVLKSENQLLNKEMARIQSEQTKGGDKKFEMTDEVHALYLRRGNIVWDFIQKASARITEWCVENRIDTVAIGKNTGWKDKVNLGDANTQNFVQIPFDDFIKAMKWRCEKEGIRLITREESYTSKASFLDDDRIPTHGDEKPEGGWKFGGYRAPTTEYYRYDEDGNLVSYKVKPRGLYKSRKHGAINSDLNGAANILRKEFPNAFFAIRCRGGRFLEGRRVQTSRREVNRSKPHPADRRRT